MGAREQIALLSRAALVPEYNEMHARREKLSPLGRPLAGFPPPPPFKKKKGRGSSILTPDPAYERGIHLYIVICRGLILD